MKRLLLLWALLVGVGLPVLVPETHATVSTAAPRMDYVGNGATATYSYTFRIFNAADLRVTVRDTSGTETHLVLNSDYTVTGANNLAGGTITLLAGNLTQDYSLTIRFDRTPQQTTDLRNQGHFLAEVHEDEFDQLTRYIQSLTDVTSRSIRMPETEVGTASAITLPPVSQRASKYLKFDAAGNPGVIDATGVGGSTVTPTYGLIASFIADLFGRELWTTDFGTIGNANDAAVLQASITATASHGNGRLHVCGVHNVGTTVTIPSNVTLTGCGIGKAIIRATASLPLKDPMIMGATGDTGLNVRIDTNITLEHITFDGIGRDYPAWDLNTNPALYGGLTASNARGNLVRFYSATNVKIINCEFMNHESLGVSLAGSKGVLVSHNVFHNNGKPDDVSPSLYVPNGSFPNGTPSAGIIVTDNYFYDNNRSAMLFNPDGGGTVAHNRFEDNGESTIFSEGGADILISDNYILRTHLTDITAHGVEINTCTNCQVTNNVIRNVDATCITGNGATNMKVANNTCINPGQATVYPGGPFNYAAGRAPNDPFSDANRSCIKFTAGSFFSDQVEINNNKCLDDQGSPTMQYGISLVRAGSTYTHTNMSITDNRVSGAVVARYNFVANACSDTVKLRDLGWPNVFQIQTPAATGQVTYSVGYRPTYIRASAITSGTTVVWSAMGAVQWHAQSGGFTEVCEQFASEETGPNMFSDRVTSQLLQMVNGSNVVQMQANFIAWTDDGFTVDWTTVTNRPYVIFETWP
jgi:hypothetical protein